MPTEDKFNLFKMTKYQCKVSEGFETSENQHTYIWNIPIL